MQHGIKSSAEESLQRPQDQATSQCREQTTPIEKVVIIEKKVTEEQRCAEHDGDEIAITCKHCTRQKPGFRVFTSKATKISDLQNALKSVAQGNGVPTKDGDTLSNLGFEDGENCVIVISGLKGVKVKVTYELNEQEVVEENKAVPTEEPSTSHSPKTLSQLDQKIEHAENHSEETSNQGEEDQETKDGGANEGAKAELSDWGLTEKMFKVKRTLDNEGELYSRFLELIDEDPMKGGIQFIQRSVTDVCRIFGELLSTITPLQLKDPFYTRFPLHNIKKRVPTSRQLDWLFIHKPNARLTTTLMEHEECQSLRGVEVLVVGLSIPALLFAIQLALCGANVNLVAMEWEPSLNIIHLLPELFEVLSMFGVNDLLPYLKYGSEEGQAGNPVARCLVIQHALLRAALVLGCKVYPNFEFTAIGGNGKVQLKARSGAALNNIDGRRLSNKRFDIICDSIGVVRDSRFNGQPVIGRKSKTLSRFYNGILCRLEGTKGEEVFSLRSAANPDDEHYFVDKEVSLNHISYCRSPFGGWMSAVCKSDLQSQVSKVDLFCDGSLTAVEEELKKMTYKIKDDWQITGKIEALERYSFKDKFKPKTFLRSVVTRGRKRTFIVLVGDAAIASFWQIGNSGNHGCMSAVVAGEVIKELFPKLKDEPRKAEEHIKNASQQLTKGMKELEHGKLGEAVHRRRPI